MGIAWSQWVFWDAWIVKNRNKQTLIFDFGGVVVDIDFNLAFQYWEKKSELSIAEMSDRFEMDSAYKKHETGEISWDEYAEHLRQSLQIDDSDLNILIGWNSIFKDKVTDVVEAIRSICEKNNCALLSNSNLVHQEFWGNKYKSFLPLFTDVFVSSEIGLRKPDHDCFQHILDKLNIEARDAIFFDDTYENVAAGREFGIESVHVRNSDDVISKLHEMELLYE